MYIKTPKNRSNNRLNIVERELVNWKTDQIKTSYMK